MRGGFALIALLLACVRVDGLLSVDVARRPEEIGIRAAPGARPSNVLAVTQTRCTSPVAVGLAIGLASALPICGAVSALPFGLWPSYPARLDLRAALRHE